MTPEEQLPQEPLVKQSAPPGELMMLGGLTLLAAGALFKTAKIWSIATLALGTWYVYYQATNGVK